MLNQIIEEAKSKETHSNDIESENKQPRNSPPRLRDHADSCMCRCRCGCVSNPINLSSQGFSAGSPLGDIESQIRLQIEERNRGKVEAESPQQMLLMSSSKGAQDINSRPLAQAKRTSIMENRDKIYENKNPMFALDRRSSRPATNERPPVRGSNITSTLANPSMRLDGHVIVDDMPTQKVQRERSRRRKNRNELKDKSNVEPHLTMSSNMNFKSNDIWCEWIVRSPRLKEVVFYSLYSANVDKLLNIHHFFITRNKHCLNSLLILIFKSINYKNYDLRPLNTVSINQF